MIHIRRLAQYSKTKTFFSNKDDIAICKSFIEKRVLDEPALAQELGRLPQNILVRWIYHILPSIKTTRDLGSDAFIEELKSIVKDLEQAPIQKKSTRYTKEEDDQLCSLVERFGTDWNLIAEEMKTRSPLSVYHRYTSSLKPGLKNHKVPFTKEEDAIIKEFMEVRMKNVHYKKWAHLSHFALPHRSPNLLRYRWKFLTSDSSPFTLLDYRIFLESLAKFGPDFHQISKEHFPNRKPLFLRNFWIYGLRRSVPELFTVKWTKELDQKLIDICIVRGFQQSSSFQQDFPQIHDLAEIRLRLSYLFKFITPKSNSIPSFPFDSLFQDLINKQDGSIKRKLNNELKIPKDLIDRRVIAFRRELSSPFTKEEDEKLIKLVKEGLENDPMGYFVNHITKKVPTKRVRLETKNITTWSEIGLKMERSGQDCRNRWNQLKYNLYQ